MKLANRRNPTSPRGQKEDNKTMFTKLKNLFKNSKIANLEKFIEELREENDARASEIYSLKKALQECQDNQENATECDIEELQSNYEDIISRVDDLETKCTYIDDYFDPNDKAPQYEMDDLTESVADLSERIEQVEQKQSLEDVDEIDAKINQLKQVKSELKTMFQNIVNALED